MKAGERGSECQRQPMRPRDYEIRTIRMQMKLYCLWWTAHGLMSDVVSARGSVSVLASVVGRGGEVVWAKLR
jgi:hypothetical protein